MAAKKPIGHMQCPLCDFPDGEVKEDKNGNPCFFCPDCTLQMLTHGREPKASLMIGKMRPVTEQESVEEKATSVESEPEPTKPADTKTGFGLL